MNLLRESAYFSGQLIFLYSVVTHSIHTTEIKKMANPKNYHVLITDDKKHSESNSKDGSLRFWQEAYLNTGVKNPLSGEYAPSLMRIPLGATDTTHKPGFYLLEHPLCLMQVNSYGSPEAKRIFAGTPYPIVFLQPLENAVDTSQADREKQQLEQQQQKAKLVQAQQAA